MNMTSAKSRVFPKGKGLCGEELRRDGIFPLHRSHLGKGGFAAGTFMRGEPSQWHQRHEKKAALFQTPPFCCRLPENQCVPQLPEEQEPPQLLPPVLAKGI